MCLSATKCKPAPTPHALTVQAQPAQQRRKTTQSATAHTQQSHTQAQLPQLAGSPHIHPLPCAVPGYGLPGPAPPAKAFIRPHGPHSLTPAATAAAKQTTAAAHSHTIFTSHSQQHSQMPQIPPLPSEPLQAEAEAPHRTTVPSITSARTPAQPHKADSNGIPDTTPDTDNIPEHTGSKPTLPIPARRAEPSTTCKPPHNSSFEELSGTPPGC